MKMFYQPNESFYMEVESFDLHYFTKIDLIFEFLPTIIGNALCLVIANYEQYGGDPMKRSILNKLLSTTCLATIFGTFPSALSCFLRAIFGGLGESISIVIIFIQILFFMFVLVNVIFIFGYKDLTILSFNLTNR